MRKFQKEQLLDIFTSLHELHRECRDKMEQKEYQIVRTALSDCQEAAIQTGEAIEQLVGEGTDAVAYLEQYCERLYNLSVQLEKLSAQKFYKSLKEILNKAENAVKHMPTRKEVVFFPYKASMWDSLESVYLAAKEDENCDAYCVPIPYYDRQADGSLGQMHYEGNEYPKNIEVIDYRTYNLEERHPDAIYIHNPYDEWNHVTCVPERYFARNLRNYTDELVYIPYFVLDEIEPDDKARIEGMKHFCFTPGVIYSHKVFVQSEKMRQIYINEYIKAAKESGLSGEHTDRKYLESKILGKGSPKFDKVINTTKENLEIPEEWLKIIEKSDGRWKKIIFYNTSVSALLQNDEKMLQKMQDVFRIFKDNKDKVALLWRPHPLIRTTIESMRPQLWEEYHRIVEQYCSEGWGIYDDSADLDRAIAISDGYYGDGSSVVQLCQKTKLPVMIQNVEVRGSDAYKRKLSLAYYAYRKIGNKMYVSCIYFNGLFEVDLQDYSVKFICRFSGVSEWTDSLHMKQTVLFGNTLFFFPINCRMIHYYSISTGKGGAIPIPMDTPAGEDPYYFGIHVLVRENKVWLFSRVLSKGVFIFDMSDKSIKKSEKLTKILGKYTKVTNFIEIPENKKIYTYSSPGKVLVEIDVEREAVREYEIKVDDLDVGTISYHYGCFWLVDSNSGDVYEWSIDNNGFRKYIAGDLKRISLQGAPLGLCCFVKDEVFVLPGKSKFVMKVDRDSGRLTKAFDYPAGFSFPNKFADYGAFGAYEVEHHKIWLHPCGGNQLLIYNTVTNEIFGKELSVDINELSFEGKQYESAAYITLEHLCDGINVLKKEEVVTEYTVGKDIYKDVVKNCVNIRGDR